MLARLKVLLPCCGFAAVYGLVVGAAFGGLLGLPSLSGLYLESVVLGGLLGGLGGVLSGMVGAVVGGRLGWTLAGYLGGVATVAPLVLFLAAFSSQPILPPTWLVGLLLWGSIPGAVGAVVGLAVGSGIAKRKSRLPGVEGLAAILDRAGVNSSPKSAAPGEADLVPAASSGARGDEPTPAAEDGQGRL